MYKRNNDMFRGEFHVELIATEHQECLAYWQWAMTVPLLQQYLIKNVNEGKRTWYAAKKLKAIGLRAGLPDYQLPYANQKFHGLWIEMKRRGGQGKTKDHAQLDWIKKLLKAGHYATFCYGADHAIKVTQDYINNKI